MEEGIEPDDPSDSVRDRQSKQMIDNLVPAGVHSFALREPHMQFRLDILHP